MPTEADSPPPRAVEVTDHGTVVKRYRVDLQHRWIREVSMLSVMGQVGLSPALRRVEYLTIELDLCVPILDLPDHESRKQELWDTLRELHIRGYWHRDVALRNVVVDPRDDQVKLIDWETAVLRSGDTSYDLYGAEAAGAEPAHDFPPHGVWWGGPHNDSPGIAWDWQGDE